MIDNRPGIISKHFRIALFPNRSLVFISPKGKYGLSDSLDIAQGNEVSTYMDGFLIK